MDRSPIVDPTISAPAFVVVVAVVLTVAALIALGMARLKLEEATRGRLDAERRATGWFRQWQTAEQRRADTTRLLETVTRSRDDALHNLHVQRALSRTMAEELDKRTHPNGWSFDPITGEGAPIYAPAGE